MKRECIGRMENTMSDMYVECLVSAGRSKTAKSIAIGLFALTVFFVLATLWIAPALLLAIITGIAGGVVWANSALEYEYLYLDKEITVDRIVAQSRRKRVATYSVDRIEAFAPIHSWHLDNFKNRDVKVFDYASRERKEPDERFAMYYEGGSKVILSPSPEFVKALANVAPRKVFKD